MKNLVLLIILLLLLFLFVKFSLYIKRAHFDQTSLKPNLVGKKIIWTYWDQGIDQIPYFNKKCIESWKHYNPEFQVIIVDKNTVFDYIYVTDLPEHWNEFMLQLKSDFVRINLLYYYGGVWIDSSIVCIKPLKEAFTFNKSIEGFAIKKFSKNNGINVFENWFISAKYGSYIIKKWREEFLNLYKNKRYHTELTLEDFKGVDFEQIDHGNFYLSMHIIFQKCLQTDAKFKSLYYNDSTIYTADDTAFLHFIRYGWDKNALNNFLQDIDNYYTDVKNKTPILKFTGHWNNDFKSFTNEQIDSFPFFKY